MNTQADRDENENMTAVEIELSVEEELIAPAGPIGFNHNETLICDSAEIELSVEDLEEPLSRYGDRPSMAIQVYGGRRLVQAVVDGEDGRVEVRRELYTPPESRGLLGSKGPST
jgi:hypothetical protein